MAPIKESIIFKLKLAIITALILTCCYLIYYFHIVLETGTVFTHLFYIPIILSSLWWGKKGIFAAVFLTLSILLSHLLPENRVAEMNDFIRMGIFLFIGFTVGLLSDRHFRALKEKEASLIKVKERIKELDCLYGLAEIVEKPRITLNGIFQELTDLMPLSWRHSEIVCSRIIFEEKEFRTKDFRLTRWAQSSDIFADKKKCGSIQVCYLEERPQADEGPFLKEERALIDALAERLGRIVERSRAQLDLEISEKKYRTIFNSAGTAMVMINQNMDLLDTNREFEHFTGYSKNELINGMKLSDFITSKDIISGIKKDKPNRGQYGNWKNSEVRLIDRTGGVKDVIINFAAIPDTEMYIASIIDITMTRKLEKEVLEISLREQQRIGHELHDGLGQHLTGIAFLCKDLKERLSERKREEADDAAEVLALTNEAINITKDLSRGLIPLESQSISLYEGLMGLADNTKKLFGISCNVLYDKNIIIKDNNISLQLYYIIKEAVNNSVKHSRAKNIEICCEAGNNEINLNIKDDGIGYSRGPLAGEGIGLSIMQYRADMIGAALEIRSSKESGTEVLCCLDHIY